MGKHIATRQLRHKMVHGASVLVGKFICLLGKTKEIAFKVMFQGIQNVKCFTYTVKHGYNKLKYNLDIGIPVTLYLTSFTNHIAQFPWHIMFLNG